VLRLGESESQTSEGSPLRYLRIGRLRSLDSVLFPEGASVFPDHAHLFPTETSILNRHAEERVFVVLVIGGKGIGVASPVPRHPRTLSRTREAPFDGGDQAGLSLHAFVIGHRVMRIADSGRERTPQMSGRSEKKGQIVRQPPSA
jgi:hypothetical protein